MVKRWYHWHVIFYWHFGTAARGKGIKVSVITADDDSPAPRAFEYLKAHVANANTLVDPSRTICEERGHGKHKPVDLPDAFLVGKVPMDAATGGQDGPASWSRRNAYLPLDPQRNAP